MVIDTWEFFFIRKIWIIVDYLRRLQALRQHAHLRLPTLRAPLSGWFCCPLEGALFLHFDRATWWSLPSAPHAVDWSCNTEITTRQWYVQHKSRATETTATPDGPTHASCSFHPISLVHIVHRLYHVPFNKHGSFLLILLWVAIDMPLFLCWRRTSFSEPQFFLLLAPQHGEPDLDKSPTNNAHIQVEDLAVAVTSVASSFPASWAGLMVKGQTGSNKNTIVFSI